jgi:hypothetical protein
MAWVLDRRPAAGFFAAHRRQQGSDDQIVLMAARDLIDKDGADVIIRRASRNVRCR